MLFLKEIGGICIAGLGIGLLVGGAQDSVTWLPYVAGGLFFIGMRMFIVALIREEKDN